MSDDKTTKKPKKEKYDIGCVPSKFWYHYVGENILTTLIAAFTHIKVKPDPDYLKEEGPIIVIANHASYLDPMIISKLTRGRPVNFVCGEFLFRSHFWGHAFKKGGAIPKKQFVVDAISVKSMMKVLKRKGSLLLFPEATRSIDGSTITFDDGLAKMAKKVNAAIYIAHIHGSYLTMPRWGKGIRKGKVTAEFVRKLPCSETAKMTAEELHDYILDGIKYDENEYAREHEMCHKGKKLAAGLQNIAYMCPKCNGQFTMQWAGKKEGDTLHCTSCGNGVKVLTNGLLAKTQESDVVYDDLHKWTMWEEEQVSKEVASDDFRMDVEAELFKVLDPFTFSHTGSGKVTIANGKITYDGTDCEPEEGIPCKKGKPVRGARNKTLDGVAKPIVKEFDISLLKGLVVSYGKYFEVYDKSGQLWRFYIDGQKVMKIRQVVNLIGHN